MLAAIAPNLVGRRIVLASKSPRRKEIFDKLGIEYEVRVSNFAEDLPKSEYVGKAVQYTIDNAKYKAQAVKTMCEQAGKSADVIIGCDTVVSLNNQIIEKPVDHADAVSILTRLSGSEHDVITGVCLLGKQSQAITTFHASTRVHMLPLTPQLIEAYVMSGEPMDKAGGYGIQGLGAVLVKEIQGDYYNVMGLPISTLFQKLMQFASDLN